MTGQPNTTAPTGPVIEVEHQGRVAGWRPETGFTGDAELVAAASEAADGGYVIEWGNLPPQTASRTTMVGVLTALMYLSPGRTTITAWPDALREWWEANHDPCGGAF